MIRLIICQRCKVSYSKAFATLAQMKGNPYEVIMICYLTIQREIETEKRKKKERKKRGKECRLH